MTLLYDAPPSRRSRQGVSVLTMGDLPVQPDFGDEQNGDPYWPNFPPEGSGMQTTLVGSAGRERAFGEAIAKVRSYRQLPNNWDTYGGKPASDNAVAYTVGLLRRLSAMPEVSAPDVSPVSNGVYLEWALGAGELYFEINRTSVLMVTLSDGEIVDSAEDKSFDVALAINLTKQFHEHAR